MEPEFRECRVKWQDTAHIAGWHNDTELKDVIADGLLEMESLGWLVYQDERFILLAMSVCNRKAGDLLKIPRACMLDMHVLADKPQG